MQLLKENLVVSLNLKEDDIFINCSGKNIINNLFADDVTSLALLLS